MSHREEYNPKHVPEEEHLYTERQSYGNRMAEEREQSAFYCMNCGKIDGKTKAGSILCWDCTELADAALWITQGENHES